MDQTFKTMVVVNPNSSNGRTGKQWDPIHEALKDKLGTFDFVMTEERGHATPLTAQALGDGYEMIVSVGGDGTHNEVVNGFFTPDGPVNSDAVFAPVTSGTGGDFRKTFGVDKGPFAAIQRLGGEDTRRIDVGRFSFLEHEGVQKVAHFVNILSFGIGGLVDHMVNTTTKALGGKTSFFIATLRALARFKAQEVTLTLDDGEPFTTTIHNVAVANGQYFGGGMQVAPDAQPDDGLFDVVSFENMSTMQFMGMGSSIYKGTHVQHKNVLVRRAKKLVAQSPDPAVLLDVDGEQLGVLPITIENLEQALRLKG